MLNTPSGFKYALQPWVVVIAAGLFFFYEFLQMTMFNSISRELMHAYSITGTTFGVLAAGYFYANVLFLFPAGIILDRISTKKLILSGLTLCILATYGMALATNFWLALFARFLIGASSTLCFLSAVRLASRWFPANKLALATGAIVTMAMLGGFVAQTPLSLLVQHFGWRHALLIDASFGFIFWFIILAVVVDYPPSFKEKHYENLRTLQEIGFWPSIWKAVTKLQNWLAGLYTSFANLSIFIIGSSFGSLFLMQVHHFSATKASFVSSMIFLGTIFGSPIIGAFSDRIANRRMPMISCGIISLVLLLIVIYTPHMHYLTLLILFFAIGFFTSSQIISYPLIAESNPKYLTSTSIGVASVLIMAGGAVFEPLFGWLLNLHWHHSYVHGVASYSAEDFHFALMILPITLVLSIVCAFFAKETYCKEKN